MPTEVIVVLLAIAVVLICWGLGWIADRVPAPKSEEVWAPMEHNQAWDHELSCRCRTCRS